jgi:TRAP-type mannitol/chloroaromatic compound transport system permease small subunit
LRHLLIRSKDFILRTLLKPTHIRHLLKFAQVIDRLSELCGQLSGWLVGITIAVGFYNVVARYIGRLIGIKLASNALIDLQWQLFSLIFLLGFPYILKHGANVRVDFLYANWREKRRALVDFIGTVAFLIPFCVMGLWVSTNFVLQSWGFAPDGSRGAWELSANADGLPPAPIKTMLMVGFGLLLLQAIAQAIKYLAIWLGYTQVAERLQADRESLPLE